MEAGEVSIKKRGFLREGSSGSIWAVDLITVVVRLLGDLAEESGRKRDRSTNLDAATFGPRFSFLMIESWPFFSFRWMYRDR